MTTQACTRRALPGRFRVRSRLLERFGPLNSLQARLAGALSLRAVTLFLALVMAVLAPAAHAQTEQRQYIIEIVLFEHTGVTGNELGGELWVPVTTGALNLASKQAEAQGFLPVEQFPALTDDAAALAGSRRYRVLRHFAWQQPGLDKSQAVAIRVTLGEAIPVYTGEPEVDENGAEAPFIRASTEPLPDSSLEIRTSTLNGTLEVRLGRFLHLQASLVYTDVEQGRSYKLYESRKMRSRELHYLDNQRFGLLARIVPVEAPAGS